MTPTIGDNISGILTNCSNTANCCELDSENITVGPSSPLSIICPSNGSTAACQTQAAVNTAYLTWLSGATASGGCAPINLSNNNPGAPSNCGGSTTVTWTANDACNVPTTCSRTFTVASPPALIINCPAPGNTASCQTQAAVNTAFTTWLSTVSASGGCVR
ncbi:MAG: hypothetical protein IPG48_05160 [Saprospiraceae bacterium]|nr:hypothetical protein [Saprospiraceae bacterium]